MKRQIPMHNLRYATFVASVLFLTMLDAQAYIDPGSSSYFFQILIAGLTAIVYFFSSIKAKVLQLFGKKAVPPVEKNPSAEKQAPPASENASVNR